QEQAISELDDIVDRLLEYYSLGMTVEQMLAMEKDMVQTQKDLLKASIQECKGIKEQSRRLHQLADNVGPRSWSQSGIDGISSTSEQLEKHDDLLVQAHQERNMMQENIRQLTSAKDLFDGGLLHRYSSTGEIHFVPRAIHNTKDDLVKQTRELQHKYANLSDQVQEIMQKKRTLNSLAK
ncbi:hypothetical protein BGZ65_004368, partial [Modicella reniformis]